MTQYITSSYLMTIQVYFFSVACKHLFLNKEKEMKHFILCIHILHTKNLVLYVFP